jgi:AcrR family transcriptional regulator
MGTQERRIREKTEKKLRILETARSLFEEKGALEVTMNDIAHATEYSIGALYGMFKNKNDIYLGLAGLGAQKMDALLVKYLAEAQDGAIMTDDQLESFLGEFVAIFSQYGNYFDVLRLSVRDLDLSQFSPDVIEMLSSSTLNSLFVSSRFFSRQIPGNLPLSQEAKDEVASGATFTSWCLLLGLSQVTAFGRGMLLTDLKKHSMYSIIIDLIKSGLVRTSLDSYSKREAQDESGGDSISSDGSARSNEVRTSTNLVN